MGGQLPDCMLWAMQHCMSWVVTPLLGEKRDAESCCTTNDTLTP
jgi:hypothetical protein